MIVEDSYSLIALHCSMEAYRVAFFLNKSLNIQLARERQDIDFHHKELMAYYPLYRYFDEINHCNYYLVSNKFKGNPEQSVPVRGIFEEGSMLATNLVAEYKTVDYFLKIEDETEMTNMKDTLDLLNKIPQIITAYAVDVENLKSKENLIFH